MNRLTKKLYPLRWISIASFVALAGCTCLIDRGGSIAYESWGKWKLVSLRSPANIQTRIPYQEILIVNNRTSNGTSVVSDSTFRDGVLVEVHARVGVPAEECNKSAISVMYEGGPQRKFWIQNSDQSLEATAYVNQLGSVSDTIRYQYELMPQ